MCVFLDDAYIIYIFLQKLQVDILFGPSFKRDVYSLTKKSFKRVGWISTF